MTKRGLLFFAVCFCTFLYAEPRSLEQLFGENIAAELRQSGKIQKSCPMSKDAVYVLIPHSDCAEHIVHEADRLSKKYIVESLYIYEKPTADDMTARISAALKKVSALKGVQYYSNTKKKYRTLYEESYCVSDDGRRIPDSEISDNDGKPFRVYQKDTTFGGNYYLYRYFTDSYETGMISVNSDDISYMFIDVADKENLVMSVLAYDTGKEIAVYVTVSAAFCSFPSFMNDIIDRSFAARSDALFAWLTAQLDAVQ